MEGSADPFRWLKKPPALPFCSLPSPTLGLRHRSRLRPGTAIAPGGGRSLYSCIYPSNWPFGGELQSALCKPGWIFRGWATASATALFGPWPCSSFVRRSLHPSPCRICRLGGALISIIHNNRRGSSSPPSARNLYKNRINCYAWVWGGPREIYSGRR
jgi:hypothetical protein